MFHAKEAIYVGYVLQVNNIYDVSITKYYFVSSLELFTVMFVCL